MTRDQRELEELVWASAYGAAYSVHALMNRYDDANADKYARNVADRCLMAKRDRDAKTPPRKRP